LGGLIVLGGEVRGIRPCGTLAGDNDVMLGALVNLSHPGHYLHWGFVQMSVANFVVIVLMVVVFAAALVIPFRAGRRHR